jgi:YidC/Oxa1 family membrane protein insertase
MLKPLEDILLQLLNFFNQYVHNYGVAIILLTITVRILLLPLTVKQTRSLQAMQKIQPKLKKLQEKYKDDKEKLQKEMMKFYSENKVNPLSGCLPLLLQLPIFFALFRMLLGNKALQKASFLLIPSLSKSAGDFGLTASQALPYNLLIILMVATTYYSQKMITTDPQQARMMVPMTLLMAFIAWRLPAGILVYWITTNIWTIVQQYVTLRKQPETTTS